MTGVTPAWGLPYPEADTLITDSAAIVQELAEKIDAALSAVTASDEYTVPGTLLQEFTTTGIFRPSAGITSVHVVVIGGGNQGGRGDGGTSSMASWVAGGGAGGEVRVYHNVPVSDPVEVIIGGSNTGSSFGDLVARSAAVLANSMQAGLSYNAAGCSHGTTRNDYPGRDGVQVNGTYYAGGGGGANGAGSSGVGGSGGAGGGGHGGGGSPGPSSGANGLGGGGGGHRRNGTPGNGGSGRVMIYTEQTLLATLELPPPTVPKIVAALDDQGHMTGAYAIDITTRELPALGVRVVDYPTEPVETGRTEIALVDPENPTGPTAVVPILAWPEAGWKYTNNKWEEPKNE